MRKVVVALGLMTTWGTVAHAQVTVISPSADILSQLGLTNETTQISKAVAQLHQLEQTYEVAAQTQQAISHLPQSAMNMGRGLLTNGLQNPMPSTQQFSSMLSGGSAGNWSGLANVFSNTNKYADPQGSDPGATELLRQRASLANVQAVSVNNIQSLEQRAVSLKEFLAGISSSPDIQETAAINARLQLEQNFVASQQAAVQNAAVMASAEQQVGQQREKEMSRASADDLVARTAGAWQ